VLQGVDIDNGGEFLNETLVRYCVGACQDFCV